MADIPHPALIQPRLYVSQLNLDVTDADLARFFETCVPVRPQIRLDPSGISKSGEIDFKFLASAEKALATLQGRTLVPPAPYSAVALSPFAPGDNRSYPIIRAQPRLIKQLPPDVTDSFLFDLFRPYGPISSISTHSSFGPDIGVVEFFEEEHARNAEQELHCADISGSNISVQVYQPRKSGPARTDFNVQAAPFVPSGNLAGAGYSPASPGGRLPYGQQGAPYGYPASPIMGSFSYNDPANAPSPFHHGQSRRSSYNAIVDSYPLISPGPGQQVQYAPMSGPGSGSHSGLIDPCNLFCKNLDLSIDSNDLFNLFKPYGQIVSARVMRGDNGVSRGFGFVSYQQPDQASIALQSMNGTTIKNKQIQVRFHEPKQLRQEKLAKQFAETGQFGQRRTSGSTSPAISDGGAEGLPDRTRRGSGSYYNAALTGSLNLAWSYEELQSLSPVVRNDVLKGELHRRVRALERVPVIHMDAVVDAIIALPLAELVQGLHDTEIFNGQVKLALDLAEQNFAQRNASSNGNGLSLSSLSLGSNPSNSETAASTTVADNASVRNVSTPPPPSGAATPSSEQDRLIIAVNKLGTETGSVTDIVDLLLTLPKKERALSLFNTEYLKSKVADAREVLRADEEDVPAGNRSAPATVPVRPKASPVTSDEQNNKAASEPLINNAAKSPAPQPTASTTSLQTSADAAAPVPNGGGPQYTIPKLAALPAVEILRIINDNPSPTGLPVPKADPEVIKSTDAFMDGLTGKTVPQQKQMLGEKLFKVIRSFGIKGAPKLTITLLDSEDLRSLSHLMNSYPDVLKEKVMLLVAKP